MVLPFSATPAEARRFCRGEDFFEGGVEKDRPILRRSPASRRSAGRNGDSGGKPPDELSIQECV